VVGVMKTTSTQITPLSIRAGKALLAQQPPAPEGLTYYVIGPYVWGKAPTAVKAAKIARDDGGKGTYILHLVNKEAEVSEVDGTLYYNSKAKGIKLGIATFQQ
jgi:hypothetical protein